MKNKWIWIIVIIVVAIVLVGAATMPFIHQFAYSRGAAAGFDNDFNGGPMMFGQYGHHRFGGTGMMRFGSFPFGFGMLFLMFFFRLIPWALFGLAVWGIYQFGKNAGRKEQALTSSAPAEPATPTPPSEKKQKK